MADYGANREKTPELSESGAVLLIVPYIFDNLIVQITDSLLKLVVLPALFFSGFMTALSAPTKMVSLKLPMFVLLLLYPSGVA
jgi:hypothetical protein